MAYETISTLYTGNVLTAAHLNKLANNAAFLNNVMTGQNWPCASFQRLAIPSLTVNNNRFTFRHRLRYLHFWVEHGGLGGLDYVRVFYGDTKVAARETPGGSPHTGAADLYNVESWPNYVGAWDSGAHYYKTVNGDGQIVKHGGVYYKTREPSDNVEPGVADQWHLYWWTQTPPTVGAFYQAHVIAQLGGDDNKIAVGYLIESPVM